MSSDAALRAAPRDRLLGELLLDAGLLGVADLERGLALQAKLGGRIGNVLMRIGAVSEDNLLQVLSRQLGLPVMGADMPSPDEVHSNSDKAQKYDKWKREYDDVAGQADVIVAKQRHGSTGVVRLMFQSNFTKFSDRADDNFLPELRT